MQQLLHFLKSIFSDNFQKSNICPIHKKRGKQKVNNYSLIITNIWRNIWKINVHFFVSISWGAQTTFNSSNWFSLQCSCINQLLFIFHTLHKAFDAYPTYDARSVFLDMPTAFDKILHKVFIHKLISIGVSGSLLKLIQSFLTKWFQKVLLNGQTSEWLPVKAGVFRGSILSSLFSVIYLSDLSERA